MNEIDYLVYSYFNEAANNKKLIIKEKIINCCKKIIISIIKKLIIDFNIYYDLYYAGCYGVLLALDKYDIKLNISFITYSYKWIKGEIYKELNRYKKYYPINYTYNSIATNYNIKALYYLINSALSSIERSVLVLYYGLYNQNTLSLIDIARLYSLSVQRISQIKCKAIFKLRNKKAIFKQ